MKFPSVWPFSRKRKEAVSLPKIDAAAIIRKARRLRFRVRRGAVADLAGAYVGARPGSGLAFAELRPYEPGDDVRHMDWNVTARQGRPYVRRFAEERALTVWLIVDISASLRFGPEGRTKADRAVQAAALLATAAIQSGDRAGLAPGERPGGGRTRARWRTSPACQTGPRPGRDPLRNLEEPRSARA